MTTSSTASSPVSSWDLLYREDPACPPDWRYAVALEHVEQAVRRAELNSIDDPAILRMSEFLWRRQCLKSRARDQLRVFDPALYDAFTVYESGGRARLHLECRILAGQTDQEITAKLRLSPAAINCYEQMFFDVRARLQARDWIVLRVLEPAKLGRLGRFEHGLKKFAYFRGPLVFEFLLNGIGEWRAPVDAEDVDEFPTEASYQSLRCWLALTIDTVPIDAKDLPRLFDLVRKLEKLKTPAASPAEQQKLDECARVTIAGIRELRQGHQPEPRG